MDWEKICSLISLSVKIPHAASHAFELLEQLIMNKVWDRSGNKKLIRFCYTKTIMFAMKRCDPCDSWTPSRPIELLCFMFDAFYPDSPDFVVERLRFLGGMTVVSKQLLLNQAMQEISNGLVLAAFEALTRMLREHTGSEQSFQSTAWLDILRYGLLPIGYDLLNDMDPNRYGRAVHVGNDEEENSSPFLYYWRQLASFDEDVLPSILADVSFPNDTSCTAGRRRRSSILKDPLALRPHVVVVQLVSLVVCEELTNLQMCSEFLAVWESVCELLVGLLEHTVIDSVSSSADGPASGEVAIATLERRSVLSAHEEILEHSKGIVRRLAVLQDEIQKQNGAKEQETPKLEDTFEAGQLDVLMQVLEDKCRSYSTLLKQLFPVNDDTMSSGGCTPRVDETSGEPSEEQSDNDVATYGGRHVDLTFVGA
uniref:Uncharacterized protein n=1 Tax=Peronospora matthiolae TaxID=2874970 RepID=A0AAV1U520_9STRA